jgi:Sulfotransferase family
MPAWDDPHESTRVVPIRKSAADEGWLQYLNQALERMPLPARAAAGSESLPLIYVIGAPRSGTTLLSQLLSRSFSVGYINNLIARFWLRPSVGITLSRICLGPGARESIPLRSSYGATDGAAGPHEFGYFWRHWLRLDETATHHLDKEELSRVDAVGLAGALRDEIVTVFGRPTVLKNVICGFQADFLSRLYRPSLFVHMTREPRATAASILASRMERCGSYEAWWSLKPASFTEILTPGDPALEVCRQVQQCRDEFAAELAKPGVSSLTIDYRDLCADPTKQLGRIERSVASMGGILERGFAPPPSLVPSPGPHIPVEMKRTIDRFFLGDSPPTT